MNKVEKQKAYCRNCGAEMEVTKESNGYSQTTGERLFIYYYTCPNRKKWFAGECRYEEFKSHVFIE